MPFSSTSNVSHPAWALACCAAAALAACGGGGQADRSDPGAAPAATTETLTIAAASLPADVATQLLWPSFHLAPLLLDAPGDVDAGGTSASALLAPHAQNVDDRLSALDTRGLTVQALQQAGRVQALAGPRASADGSARPAASGSVVATYTPAQVRAAYGFAALPAIGTVPTPAQAAQFGAGQTIYIVDAMHDPNVVAELNAFNTKFGLPACSVKALPTGTALPLAPASTAEGCVVSVAYATAAGAIGNTAPAVDSGWATEIALDVQWAHATAPLARIVLIEVPDASLNSLLGGIKLANAMGPGAVSMSFGGTEGSWTASVDSAFSAAGMSYFAATGDSGAAVSWPAVSSRVLAVGGTSLGYSGGAARTETVWAKTGGGVSLYTATPAYQSNAVPGVGTLARRGVADVSFNADPSTGQYVAVMAPGSSTVSWVSAGGTSLSTPQWAGLVAVANAVRARSGKAPVGAPHAALYGQIGAVAGTYAAAFADIRGGANGSCATCGATAGYDLPSGLGTPHVGSLLGVLTGTDAPAAAPLVGSATVSGKAGTALTFSLPVSAANPVDYTLAAAPAGMTIAASGVVGWPKPVAGSYAVTVIAKDTKTGLSGTGVATLKVDAATATPPVITASALVGAVGKPLAGSFTVADPGNSAMSVSISGAPGGMGFSATGQTVAIAWPKPVQGSYALVVTARNAAGLVTQATIPVTIAAK